VPNAALRFRPAGADAPPGSASGGGTAAAPPVPGTGSSGRPSPEVMRERIVKSLGLTAEQQRKLDPIFQDLREQMAGLQDIPEAERQQRGRRIREEMRVRIREILTPEQQLKFDASDGRGRARGGSSGRVFVVDEHGKPKAIPLTLGISDGNTTEIIRGELTEGQDVIVGGSAAAGGRPGAGGSGQGQPPRLRL
jgi:HlyD family secretion protein